MYKNIAITKVVFVSSMSYNTTEDDLRNFFADCGKITNIRFIEDKTNASLGSAYVAFESHKMALMASYKDDTCLKNRFLKIDLNRMEAIEEIMTRPNEDSEDKKSEDKKSEDKKSEEKWQDQNNFGFKYDEYEVSDDKTKSHDEKYPHKHKHKHRHKHHKHKHHHDHDQYSSDEGVHYYTELPE